MKHTVKSALSLLLASSMMLSLASCGGGDTTTGTPTPGGTTDGGGTGGIAPIKMQLAYWDAEAPTGDGVIMTEIMKQLGVQLDVTWVPSGNMQEKTTTTIVGGNMPEVMTIINSEMRTQVVQDAVDGGMFWDLTDYIDDYENLSTIPDSIRESLSYGGKIYSIPRMTILRDGGLVLREDWLDNLGLEVPRTAEDFYNVFEQFTYGDPDGNGVDDTIGLGIFIGIHSYVLELACGLPREWYVDEATDEVKHMYTHEKFPEYLDFLKSMYDAGFINKDFAGAVKADIIAQVNQEKVGALPDSFGNVSTGTAYTGLYSANPDAKLVSVTGVDTPDGKYVAGTSEGFWGMYYIPKSTVQTEERLREILQVLNDTMNPEIMDLFVKGIEGVHYTETDGEFQWIDQALYTKDALGTSSFYVGSVIAETMKLGLVNKADEYYAFETDTSITNMPNISGRFTPTSVSAAASTAVQSAATKYVMGTGTREEVMKSLADWVVDGGQEHMDDWTAQYRASKG